MTVNNNTKHTMSKKTKDILEFWFGGEVETNYTTKWFPSGKKQKCMDEEIKREFGDTLKNVLEAKDLSSWTSNPCAERNL